MTPAHLRCMESGGTSESGLGNYVSLAELAAELKVSVQTIYVLRSKGRGPHGFRVGTQLRFRKAEIDAWVQRMELADERRHAGGAS
ncbi:helix-turn-helix transcriptional regulator [Microbacterium aurantiacum]|nr:helix-turn-helix domain-containing protein [Microbacterium chocolatum]